jgi:hypothetical protein
MLKPNTFLLNILLIIASVIVQSCNKNLPQKIEVYRNDFEQGRRKLQVFKVNDETKDSLVFKFNNTQILGPLNHNTVFLQFDTLPTHQLLQLEFDLYIHDSWKGNDGLKSDFWAIYLDRQRVFMTTFANLPGTKQAYPEPEGSNFYPGANSFRNDLPGLCSLKSSANGTAVYQFAWKIKHSNRSLMIALTDLVAETDLCLKSWSIDNLVVTCIAIENQ